MNLKPLLVFAIALVCTLGHAAIQCQVICPANDACLNSPLRPDACDASGVEATKPATVWYPKASQLARKDVAAGTAIAKAVADGDHTCQGFRCLFNIAPSRVVGGLPMGKDSGSREVSRAVLDAGLPYGDVEVSGPGLAFKVERAESGGTFTLLSEGRRTAYPAPGGRVLVPAKDLKPGDAYTYEWSGPGGPAAGGFLVARPKTAKRAHEVADETASGDANPQNQKFALVAGYLSTGLSWNARKLLLEIERGE